mmetsp:Transcript_58898/g.172390  ORF Transcript_58898/g.172390 Transcript_58898/m.172390 type:complete len:236 (+) Transcript_58898:260-967(+)
MVFLSLRNEHSQVTPLRGGPLQAPLRSEDRRTEKRHCCHQTENAGRSSCKVNGDVLLPVAHHLVYPRGRLPRRRPLWLRQGVLLAPGPRRHAGLAAAGPCRHAGLGLHEERILLLKDDLHLLCYPRLLGHDAVEVLPARAEEAVGAVAAERRAQGRLQLHQLLQRLMHAEGVLGRLRIRLSLLQLPQVGFVLNLPMAASHPHVLWLPWLAAEEVARVAAGVLRQAGAALRRQFKV